MRQSRCNSALGRFAFTVAGCPDYLADRRKEAMRHESRLQSQSVLCVNAKCPELPMAHLAQLISCLGRHPVRITWRTGPFRFSGDTATLEGAVRSTKRAQVQHPQPI